MKRTFFILFIWMCCMAESCIRTGYQWGTLPAIPDKTGFAGSFAGVANGALIVAGGSNFPDGGTPWNGGKKTWYDKIFVLEKADGQWKEAGKLPRPLGYGVSVSTEKGLICIGGSNAEGHYADAFLITYKNGQIHIDSLPPLPAPLANTCGTLVDDRIYVAGGLRAPDSKESTNDFYMLDLPTMQWSTLPAWPGPSRMLSIAGSLQHDFFLFSGATLQDGKRTYLKDAYRYNRNDGWTKIADMPVATVAAPTPAFAGSDVLEIFGGDSGKDAASAAVLREHHPGFSNAVLAYEPATNSWRQNGQIQTKRKEDAVGNPNGSIWAPVTTTFVHWGNLLVFPGGEVRPGTRTNNVITASVHGKQ